MRRFGLFLLALCLVLSVSVIVAQETPPPSAPVLQVVDSTPFVGEEMGLQSDIVLYFNRPLDCASAQSALSITPAVPGTVTCDDADSSLHFAPSTAYERDLPYTVALSTGVQAQDGAKLAEPFTLELNSLGYLAVSDTLPIANSTEVSTTAVITAIFNRPVVPLVTAEEAATLPSPIVITPDVPGKGEWLNTSIYVFHPDPAMAGGLEYTVTVNPDLQAVDGSTLQAPVSWSFTTQAPSVSEVTPLDLSTNAQLNQKIQVRFNQPMNQASVEANFFLRPQDGTAVSGTFEWAEDGAGFAFTPAASLALDTVYDAGFSGAVQGAVGGADLTNYPGWSFATVPYPAIISTDPQDGAADVYPWGSVTLYFASAMDIDTLADKITIDPKPWRDPDYYYSEYDNSYTLNFPIEPSTAYTVTIAPGMADIYGNQIASQRVISFTTSPFDPEFVLNVPGSVGFYNAHAENTQLFLTHRNITSLDLQLYSVSLQNFANVMSVDPYSGASNMLPPPSDLLRQWSLPVTSQPNAQKYQLLTLGGEVSGSGSFDCPGAAPSRVKVGDTAIVISDPNPVRARSNAPDGEVLAQLYKDYQLPIIGGPVCANNILWWQVRLRDETQAWVAEAIPGDNGQFEYLIDVRIAADITPVQLAPSVDGTDALAPGLYLLRVSSPETASKGYAPYSHLLIVGTANLTMKYAVDSVLIWATDVQTGAPLANAPITLYDPGYNPITSGTTDADGLLCLPIDRVTDLYQPRYAVLQTDSQFGVGYIGWSDGIEPYQFGQNYNYYPSKYVAYLYTDRPIYRPDQPVYFRGVVRTQSDVTFTPPDFATIPVKIYDVNGQIVFDQSVQLSQYGTFSGQFDIAADAGLGYYSLQVELPPTDPTNSYPPTTSIGFGVAEYRLPEFQVNVTPAADQVVQGDTISVTIDSRYFFGGLVSNANVEYSVVSDPYIFQYEGQGYYDFMDFDYDSGASEFYGTYGQEVAGGTGTTDDQGRLTIEIPATLEDAAQSRKFTIEATVTDESQQIVAGRVDVVVHKGLVYVGARPENYVGVAGQEAAVNLIAVDWESNGIANQNIDVEVVERRWSSVQEQDEAGRTIWNWEVEEIPVTTGSATTDDQGKAIFKFTPPNGGIFKVKLKTRDAQGNEVIAATTMWVSSDSYVSWRQQNSNRVDLIADQRDYQVGDTAEILITSPFQGTTEALVTVERGSVISVQHITMTSNSTIYKLPISADFAPNVYVTVMLIKGVDPTNPVPAFRYGLVQLGVDNDQKEIRIEITPDVEQAGPGDTVNYTVKTTDYQGNPVQAEVGVGLTDLASLSIADPNSGPLLAYFYGQQGLGVRTATPLTINVDQLTQTVLDTVKGGGGGGGEGGIFDIRQDFIDTAYWNASLVTGADGTATFSVTLPDNLTTWRLDARAVTSGADGLTLVGQDTFDLISTKPLLIRPVTPRFLVVGDQVTLAAIVNNNTGAEMPVEVTIQGTGLTFTDSSAQTFTIPSGGRQRVEWTATVDDAPSLDLTFFANGGGGAYTDASKPPLGQGDNQLLPVYKYEAPETVGTAGLLREGGSITESIVLPRRFEVTQGTLTLNLDPSLASSVISSLNYLENFPYQCTEQTVSKFLPNIMTFRALESLGLVNETLSANLQSAVNFGLQRLYAQQKPDGGWGWFVQDASNPLTTAYALIGLAEAQSQGFPVSPDVIMQAQNYLRTTFIVPDQSQEVWRLNRQAFTLYALARSGAGDVARSATLFDARDRLSIYAKAFLGLTFNLIDPSDTSRTDTLVSDLVNSAVLSATGAHWQEAETDYWNWNTDTRTTAIVLDALIKLRPQNDLIPNIVRWLMIARTADHWETTQETAWATMSLTDWMVLSGELQPDYSYSAVLNGEQLTQGTATPQTILDSTSLVVQVADLLASGSNELVIGRTEGSGVLYYTAHLEAYLPVPEVEALNRGIIVERRYTLADSDAVITSARVGDLIDVRLTIIAPNDLYYAVIEDPIPAGTEAINPNLSTEQQIGTQPAFTNDDPLSYGWGWWYFSNIEFRDQKVVLNATYLPAGTYEFKYSLRAGLPGVYNVIPATGQEFYTPEVYGRSAGSLFTVLPAQ